MTKKNRGITIFLQCLKDRKYNAEELFKQKAVLER
ncbi:hypothetical protein DFO73_12052 [Cytobacillus oceanisediminis]|jgi:hypothetical protein|uniref:Uncharacterized protein n=1 Tax=Cytobacillus oceanisediminis TaxID=665099 RepID=A0A2V2ZIJ8_9BACI|nr:hypothetical protein DFO73_12052 [Cytobacillus oceanisediminis]